MASLYEIMNEISACIDEETGEILDFEKLDELLVERETKIENVALWVKNLDAEINAIKVEIDALKQRMECKKSKVESLEKWLANALENKAFETAKCAVSFRKSEAVEVDEDVLDKEWLKAKTTYTPDKTAIKKALKNGEIIDGATLITKQNIQIK